MALFGLVPNQTKSSVAINTMAEAVKRNCLFFGGGQEVIQKERRRRYEKIDNSNLVSAVKNGQHVPLNQSRLRLTNNAQQRQICLFELGTLLVQSQQWLFFAAKFLRSDGTTSSSNLMNSKRGKRIKHLLIDDGPRSLKSRRPEKKENCLWGKTYSIPFIRSGLKGRKLGNGLFMTHPSGPLLFSKSKLDKSKAARQISCAYLHS